MWLDLLKMAGDFPQTFYKAADALSQSAYHTLRDNAPINWIKLLEDAIFKVWTVTPRDWEESTTETLDGFELQATIHFLLVKFAELGKYAITYPRTAEDYDNPWEERLQEI